MIRSVFRTDPTNVGDWYCSPFRYFDLGALTPQDILSPVELTDGDNVIVGGGGLVARTFAPAMAALAAARPRLGTLIAWGIGESLHVDKTGGLVAPWGGPLPDYLDAFDLVGLRDHGTAHEWVPCPSCMLDLFDRPYAITCSVAIYEHKRIPVPIAGLPRRSNDGQDIEATLAFLGSAELIVTNSYHGAYWATLLGRRVIAIPNLSKVYRLRHAPVIARADNWHAYAHLARAYPDALAECRAANRSFHRRVRAAIGSNGASVASMSGRPAHEDGVRHRTGGIV